MAVTLPEKILQYLDSKGKGDSLQLAAEWKEDIQKIVGAIKSLESIGNVRNSLIVICVLSIKFSMQVISVEQYTNKQWELTAEGNTVAANGSHEAVVYNSIPNEGIPQPELMVIMVIILDPKCIGLFFTKYFFSE